MFEKYGNFNSAEDINEKCDDLLTIGDTDAVRELAEENGVEEEITTLYCDGEIPILVDIQSAAVGKIEIESKDVKLIGVMNDWVEYIKSCTESEPLALAVREKGKSLIGCLGAITKVASKGRENMDKRILDAAGINQMVSFGMPSQAECKKIITDYYLS